MIQTPKTLRKDLFANMYFKSLSVTSMQISLAFQFVLETRYCPLTEVCTLGRQTGFLFVCFTKTYPLSYRERNAAFCATPPFFSCYFWNPSHFKYYSSQGTSIYESGFNPLLYRNQNKAFQTLTTAERSLSTYSITPFTPTEVHFQTRYSTFSATAFRAGQAKWDPEALAPRSWSRSLHSWHGIGALHMPA